MNAAGLLGQVGAAVALHPLVIAALMIRIAEEYRREIAFGLGRRSALGSSTRFLTIFSPTRSR
jgi:hypothetical protein